MKKSKIYLQYPWRNTDSPYYLYLRQNPPKNIKYINAEKFGLYQETKRFKFNNFLKRKIKKILGFVPFLPNAHFTFAECDLIHCAHCLSLNKKPWVCDIEYVNQFWASGRTNIKTPIRKLVMDKHCKGILAWTEWTKKGILEIFPEFDKKIKVIYPAMPLKIFKKTKRKKITLLYSSRRFFFKGGLHAVAVMDKMTRKYPHVDAIIVSDTPKEIIHKYKDNPQLKFLNPMKQTKLFEEIYPKCDIFVYPSYTDTYGFGLMEALSFGIPTVTVEGQSRSEIITNKKTGFIIPLSKKFADSNLFNLWEQKDTIKKIEEKVELLITNKKIWGQMSKNCLEEIKNGKFSIKKRNKDLLRIYSSCLR